MFTRLFLSWLFLTPVFFSSSKNQLLIDANHSSFITTWNSNLLRVDKKQQKFSQIMNYLP